MKHGLSLERHFPLTTYTLKEKEQDLLNTGTSRYGWGAFSKGDLGTQEWQALLCGISPKIIC